jgi:exodeoxyribonuclease-3
MRVISLNLNGIRSAAGKGLYPWLENQNADLVCLQELKAQAADLSPEMLNPPKLAGYFHHAEKKGYSGVGIYTRHRPTASSRVSASRISTPKADICRPISATCP